VTDGMNICRSGSFLAVCPSKFVSAICLAAGFGESRNWNSSTNSVIAVVVSVGIDLSTVDALVI